MRLGRRKERGEGSPRPRRAKPPQPIIPLALLLLLLLLLLFYFSCVLSPRYSRLCFARRYSLHGSNVLIADAASIISRLRLPYRSCLRSCSCPLTSCPTRQRRELLIPRTAGLLLVCYNTGCAAGRAINSNPRF